MAEDVNTPLAGLDPELRLRDRFAIAALAAILDAHEDDLEETGSVRELASAWARRAYIVADAMLAAREDALDPDEDEDAADEEDPADDEDTDEGEDGEADPSKQWEMDAGG